MSLRCQLRGLRDSFSAYFRSNFTRREFRFVVSLLFLVTVDQLTARVYTHRPESIAELLSLPGIEWYWFIKDVVCWTALLSIPLFLTGKYARSVYLPFIIVFVLATAACAFTWANFRMQLDGDWIGIILGSSTDEFLFFLKSYALKFRFFAGTLLLGAVLYALCGITKKLKPVKPSATGGCVAFACLALFVLMMPVSSAFRSSPAFFLLMDSTDNWTHYRKMARIKHAPKIPKDLKSPVRATKLTLGVFILGESATRNHWSLYGYPKKTTPEMDAIKDELAVFTDLVTPVSNTAKAMELIFTHSALERPDNPKCTYAQMLKATGFDVSLYSSQSRWGRWDGVESFIFAGSDPLVFLDEEHLTGPWYDDKLLDYLDRDISSQTNQSVTILHLRGSHFPAQAHYPCENRPAALEKFIAETSGPNADTNSYDTSIFFTDSILGKTVERLKQRGGPAWMIYLSDHGDSIGANSWRLTNDRNVWEVPMIIWFSADYANKFPDIVSAVKKARTLPLQSDLLLAGFLHIAGVKGWEIGSEKDFLSELFKPRFPRLIEGGKLEYNWIASPKGTSPSILHKTVIP